MTPGDRVGDDGEGRVRKEPDGCLNRGVCDPPLLGLAAQFEATQLRTKVQVSVLLCRGRGGGNGREGVVCGPELVARAAY